MRMCRFDDHSTVCRTTRASRAAAWLAMRGASHLRTPHRTAANRMLAYPMLPRCTG